MKKHIIFSSYDDIKNPYYGGGGAMAIHQVTKRLAKNFSITVITGNYPGAVSEIVDGVFYKRISLPWLGPKIGQLVFQFFLPFYVMKESYDVWIESFTPPFSTACLQLFTKKPVIGLVHMLSGEDMWRKYKIPFFLIERFGVRTYKHIITLTGMSKEKVHRIAPKTHITVIPNGVDLPKKSLLPVKKKHILFMGRLEINQKGLDLLLKSYAKVADRIAYPLVIAGMGVAEEEQQVREMIQKFSLEEKVHMAGRVAGKEKDKLLREAVFLVSSSRYETFGMIPLEAFSYNAPLVMFAIPPLAWVPDELTIKVPPFNVSKFSEALVEMSENKKLREDISKKTKAFVKNFTWDSVANQYKEMLNAEF